MIDEEDLHDNVDTSSLFEEEFDEDDYTSENSQNLQDSMIQSFMQENQEIRFTFLGNKHFHINSNI